MIVADNDVKVSGTIAAPGGAGVAGGNVSITAGHDVNVQPGALISAQGNGANSAGGSISVYGGNNATFAAGATIDASAGARETAARSNSARSTGSRSAAASSRRARAGGRAGSVLVDPTNLDITANITPNDGTSINADRRQHHGRERGRAVESADRQRNRLPECGLDRQLGRISRLPRQASRSIRSACCWRRPTAASRRCGGADRDAGERRHRADQPVAGHSQGQERLAAGIVDAEFHAVVGNRCAGPVRHQFFRRHGKHRRRFEPDRGVRGHAEHRRQLPPSMSQRPLQAFRSRSCA